MSIDLDEALARLATDTPHRGLADFEGRVLNALAGKRAATLGVGVIAAAMGVALAVGAFSNVVPAPASQADARLSPLGVPSALAPSTLLAGPR